MSKVVEICLFKINEGVTEEHLLGASDLFNESFLAKQKGFISRQFAKDGDTWSDVVLWESMEDAMNAVKAFEHALTVEDPAVMTYGLCINEEDCTMQHLTIVKSY